MKDSDRRALFVAWFSGPPMRGDREALIRKSGYSKGRISQFFDPEQQFGERAARSLADRLGLPSETFNSPPSANQTGITQYSGPDAPIKVVARDADHVPSLFDALPVVVDAIAALPPLRWAAVRSQLDHITQHPEMRDDALPELLQQLTMGDGRMNKALRHA